MIKALIHIALMLSIALTFSFGAFAHAPSGHAGGSSTQVEDARVILVADGRLSVPQDTNGCPGASPQFCQGWIFTSIPDPKPNPQDESVSWPGLFVLADGRADVAQSRPPRS